MCDQDGVQTARKTNDGVSTRKRKVIELLKHKWEVENWIETIRHAQIRQWRNNKFSTSCEQTGNRCNKTREQFFMLALQKQVFQCLTNTDFRAHGSQRREPERRGPSPEYRRYQHAVPTYTMSASGKDQVSRQPRGPTTNPVTMRAPAVGNFTHNPVG